MLRWEGSDRSPWSRSQEDEGWWEQEAAPRQRRVPGEQRASVPPFPALSRVLFPIQLMTLPSRSGDPARLTPLQSRIWPSSRLARSHTTHATSFQQVHGKPEMDPPSNTLLGPKSIFAPCRATPRAPQQHGSRSWVTSTGTRYPTDTHPLSRLQDSKTK